MNLVPFSKQYLRLNEALPFGLRDAAGRLLLAAGSRVGNSDRLDELRSAELYADESESSDWRRRLGGAMDAMLLRNAPLGRIADARPDPHAADDPNAVRGFTLRFGEQWDELVLALDALMREPGADRGWSQRVLVLADRVRALGARRFDDSLYHLIYTAGHSTDSYTAHHGLLCMLVAQEAARMLRWDEDLSRSLAHAALTMNVSARRLQDMLAAHAPTMSPAMRAELDAHPQKSAELLGLAGIADPVWLEIVQLHHDDSREGQPLDSLTPAQQAARLLRRIDIFTAKLSRRANLPLVAVLVAPSGAPMGTPALRDTLDRRHAVKRAISVDAVKVIPPHERLMMMR